MRLILRYILTICIREASIFCCSKSVSLDSLILFSFILGYSNISQRRNNTDRATINIQKATVVISNIFDNDILSVQWSY